MIDTKLIQKLDFIVKYVGNLKNLLSEMDINNLVQWEAMERMTEKIIESAISVNHIILEKNEVIVQSYYDSFIQLKKFGFDENLVLSLAKTTGFRNRLAHDYLELDKKITFESVKKIPLLYSKYVKEINKILE